MKHISEIVAGREPTAEELTNRADVLEIAQAWESGGLDLRGVRSACSGHDRWRAMRFVGTHNADKDLLLHLAGALVADLGDVVTKGGTFQQVDFEKYGAWIHNDENGNRVIRFKGLDEDGRAWFRPIPAYKLEEGRRADGQWRDDDRRG